MHSFFNSRTVDPPGKGEREVVGGSDNRRAEDRAEQDRLLEGPLRVERSRADEGRRVDVEASTKNQRRAKALKAL